MKLTPVTCSTLFLAVMAVLGITNDCADAADVAKIKLTSPQPYEVVQREEFEAATSHEHHTYGATLGHADVRVEGTLPDNVTGRFEFRVVMLKDAFGIASDWMRLDATLNGQAFQGPVEVNAGGWYRLEIRCVDDDKTVAEASVEPFGVGEVFVIAGQSYASGANEELLKVTESQGRVAAYDWKAKKWQPASDPQPHSGDGGTIWPALGDLLVPMLRVPVGFVNVAVGGTSTRQWMPDGDLHKNLVQAGKSVGSFRAVLWQQGESDVIEKTTTEVYIKNMIKIRESAAVGWRLEPPWLLAKSTLHPTVYNDPQGEERIRTAIQQLWKRPHFAQGPDTDLLSGENRGDMNSKRHFTGIGQRRAALLWFVAIWNELDRKSR